jgi:hypothetical protein
MKRKNVIKNRILNAGSVAGAAAIIVYLTFTLISYFLYPKSYSPVTNWLSDLGNPVDSSSGSAVYRVGCILTATALIIFYVQLRRLNTGNMRMKILLAVAQIAGVFSCFALIVTGIFPFGTATAVHSLWSMILYIAIAFFEAFSASVFLRYTSYPKWTGYYGIAAAAINFVTGAIFNSVIIGEWVTVATFIVYICVISYYSRLIEQTELLGN